MEEKKPGVPVIRFIKIILDICWYVMIIGVVVMLFVATFSDKLHIPLYWAEVKFDSSAVQYEIKSLGTQTNLDGRNPLWEIPAFMGTGYIAIVPPNQIWKTLYLMETAYPMLLPFIPIFLLRRLFRDLKKGSIFTVKNAERLRYIGLTIFLGYLLDAIFTYGMQRYLDSLVWTHGMIIQRNSHVDLNLMFFCLVMWAVAELFRHGVELEQEKELTI
jgi:hypothetical protein